MQDRLSYTIKVNEVGVEEVIIRPFRIPSDANGSFWINPNYKFTVAAPDPNKTCEDYGLPNNQCYFYYDPKLRKRFAYYYPYKYMDWVEQYNRLDYQLKDKK